MNIMKAPLLLKTILDICFILLALTYFSALFVIILTLIMGESFYPIELNGSILTEFSAMNLSFLSAELIIGSLTLYTLYLLRKLIRNFFSGKLYTRFQIATFNLVGQLIVFITISQAVTDILGSFLLESKASIGVTMDLSFSSFWFILAIGLFFIYLSKIFKNAKNLKEENELTV